MDPASGIASASSDAEMLQATCWIDQRKADLSIASVAMSTADVQRALNHPLLYLD